MLRHAKHDASLNPELARYSEFVEGCFLIVGA